LSCPDFSMPVRHDPMYWSSVGKKHRKRAVLRRRSRDG
jgi:hypothetical protein